MSGIELTSVGLLFDDRETGDAVQRLGLHSESGRWNLMIAAGTDSVRTCMQRCECLLNPAELLDGEQFDGQSDIALMLRGGLVDRVRKEFGLCGDEVRHHSLAREHRSDSMEFVLEIRVIRALLTDCRRENAYHQDWNELSSR